MEREQVAELIGWTYIITAFGVINVVAMIPQLIQILRTKKVEGLSLGMFYTYFAVQVAYAIHGFFNRDLMLMIPLALCASVSLTVVILVNLIRRKVIR